MRFLRQFADGQHISLFDALRRSLDDPLFKGTGARDFVGLVDKYSIGGEGRTVSELLAALLDESGYERALRTEGSQERLDNLAELRQSVFEYETQCGEEATLDHYLTHVAFFSNMDQGESRDRVKLMTVHSAKGLEFPNVFLCAMNEGVFPSRKVRTVEGMEEERRLAFVAFTRAQRRLFLSDAEGTTLDGMPRYPSRFVLDVDPALLVYDAPPRDSLVREARDYIAAKSLSLARGGDAPTLPAGTRVRHRVFGAGTILSSDDDRGAYAIQFDEMDTPRSISMRVKLERL